MNLTSAKHRFLQALNESISGSNQKLFNQIFGLLTMW